MSTATKMESTPEICAQLRHLVARDRDFERATGSLTRQVRAMARRVVSPRVIAAMPDATDAKVRKAIVDEAAVLYDATVGTKAIHPLRSVFLEMAAPYLDSRAMLEASWKDVKKQQVTLAKQLPVYPWVESVKGFGDQSFARIIGETGDLSNYANPAKVWKRMGLAVINGGRQRKVTGEEALAHGYNPVRRSVMYVIGETLFKQAGPYRELYLERKQFEREKAEAAGLQVVPAAKIPEKRADEFMSDGHVHNRAKRYMEKRLLRDLWRQWRDA